MRLWCPVVIACVGALFVASAPATPRRAERGFRSLCNGRDLTGWVLVGQGEWNARDGEIVCAGKGGGWLRTARVYQNFVLRLEYNIAPRGNSGIFVRAPEQGRSSQLGFEVQILDDAGKPPNNRSTGSLYEVAAPSKNRSRPAGEWNQVEILCHGTRVAVTLNGEKIVDIQTDDPALNARLDDDHKANRRHTRGYIGLQDHGAPIRFRNIRLRTL